MVGSHGSLNCSNCNERVSDDKQFELLTYPSSKSYVVEIVVLYLFEGINIALTLLYTLTICKAFVGFAAHFLR